MTVGEDSVIKELPSNVFDLKRDDSYLFVGQPPKDFQLPAGLKKTTLLGGFDNLFLDRRKVGLYDALVSNLAWFFTHFITYLCFYQGDNTVT